MDDGSVVIYFFVVYVISFVIQAAGIFIGDWGSQSTNSFHLSNGTNDYDYVLDYTRSDEETFYIVSFAIHFLLFVTVICQSFCNKFECCEVCCSGFLILLYAIAGILSITGCSITASLASPEYFYGISYYLFLGSGIFITAQATLATFCCVCRICRHCNTSNGDESPQQNTAATNETHVRDLSSDAPPETSELTDATNTEVRAVVNRGNVAVVERKHVTTVETTAASGGLNRGYIAATESRELTTVTTTGTSGRLNRGYGYQERQMTVVTGGTGEVTMSNGVMILQRTKVTGVIELGN